MESLSKLHLEDEIPQLPSDVVSFSVWVIGNAVENIIALRNCIFCLDLPERCHIVLICYSSIGLVDLNY